MRSTAAHATGEWTFEAAGRSPQTSLRRLLRRVATAVCAVLLAGALFAPDGSARIRGPYQLEFGFAKRAIARFTAAVCSKADDCRTWSVKPCRRRSWHRIDCVSNILLGDGTICRWVTIAVWPPSSDELLIHRKRIFCRTPE